MADRQDTASAAGIDAAVELSEPELPPSGLIAAPIDRLRGARGLLGVTRSAVALAWEAAPRTLLGALALQVVSAVLVAAQLLVLKGLVAELVILARDTNASVSGAAPAFFGLVLLTLAMGITAALLQRQQRMLGEQVGRRTLDRIIDVASRVELARFEEPGFHDQLERATQAATFRPLDMVNGLMALLLGVLTSLGIMVALATIEVLLLPLVVLAGVPVLIATLINSRQSYAFEYAMTTHARERLHLLELFVERDSAKELRAFDATAFLRRRYDALSDERISRVRVFLRGRLKVAVVGTVAGAVGAAIAIGALVALLAGDRIGLSAAATAAVAMQVLAGRLSAVTGSVGKLVESGMFLNDLRAFLTLDPGPEHRDQDPTAVPERFQRLEVEGLSFTYPGTQRRVLDDVHLELNRGEVVALVGENGSGKTTLVKILCRLYGFDEGAVRWNGTHLDELDAAGLRSQLTVLFQDFVRYHLSVSENILLGRAEDEVDAGRIRAAAEQAGAAEAVGRLPRGYETRLGRHFIGGHELSGGEWQRLALARAFYRGGELLVMDEPTAALDPRAEYRLFEQIRQLAAGKSVLLISHRFANVRMADRIYVLDGGRVAQSGSHDELMAQGGIYRELFELQASSYLQTPR